jgi:ABC-type bacteriocin/lantibiotic exporter with double-glycine peptidase domain
MVLAALGTFKTEEELRLLSGCTEEGTMPKDLVDAAKKLGFNARLETYSNLDKLKLEVDTGYYPIVSLRVRSSPNISRHVVVVVEISESGILVFDPDKQWREYLYSKLDFWRQWTDEQRCTIVIG